MRRALHDGARGIPPARPGDTAATRAARGEPGDDGRWPARAQREQAAPAAVAPQAPAPRAAARAPVPARHRPRARAAAARGARAGPARRGPAGLMALALAIVAIVVLTAPAPTKVELRNVVYDDVQQTASALKQLISENTK